MVTPAKKTKGDVSELIFYCAIIALPLLQIAVFYFYVNFNSIMLAFKEYTFVEGFEGFTWNFTANFDRLWYELTEVDTLWSALKNSVVMWIFTTVLGTFLAIVFSYYIFKQWPLAKTFKFFLFLPSVLPSILLVGVYKFFVNNALPGYLGTANALLDNANTLFPTVIFYNVWICFGAQLLIYTGAMDQVDTEIIEAAQLDGVSPIQEFFSIVVPIILPTISTFVIANVATLFTNQANLYAFFGADPVLQPKDFTIGYYLFRLVGANGGMDNYPYASLLGIICTCIAFPLTMLVRSLLNGKEAE